MTPANKAPWYTKAGAATSIVPISHFVGPNMFALKGGGYGCLFSLEGVDPESCTDDDLNARTGDIEAALRGLPEDACLYQYTRVRVGFPLPKKAKYENPVTESFVKDRLQFLGEEAAFRRIDLYWALTVEPEQANLFSEKPKEHRKNTDRQLFQLEKAATILEAQLLYSVGLELLSKGEAFQFFSYLFNLDEWASEVHLRADTGVDRQIAGSPVEWHSDYLRIGRRYVQMFSLINTPEISRPCLFANLMQLECDSVLCSVWRPRPHSATRKEVTNQEKFLEFFKLSPFQRLMSGRNTAPLETTASAKAVLGNVESLTDVVASLEKLSQGDYALRLLLSTGTVTQLRAATSTVHRLFVDARAPIIEESYGNLSAFYAMFPGNRQFNVYPLWLREDHHARLSSVFVPFLGHPHSDDLDNEYLNIFETRTRTPYFQDAYVNGVRVQLILGPTGTGKSSLMFQVLRQIRSRGDSAIVYDPAREFVKRFYDPERGDVILNPLDKRCPYWGPAEELRSRSEAKALSVSFFQPPQDRKGEFFIESPQKIFAFLMAYGPTPEELVQWMSNPDEIDRRLKGTEHAHLIDPKAQQQRAGVLASLGLVADSLRLLPKKGEGNGAWTATEWAVTRQGWVFLTSLPAEREALRPLQSLWIDWLVLRLLNEPTKEQKRVWFIIDELASLQKLPQLHTAITENRKSRNPVVLGFQGKAQLEYIYGHLAEVMLSQPATSIWLTTKEPKAGQWVSEFIGKVETERLRETHFDGTRAGRNFAMERQVEPLVLESEISGLPDLHAYMKYQNYVTYFSFPYFDMTEIAKPFELRERPDDKLPYDPQKVRDGAEASPMELKPEPQPAAPQPQTNEPAAGQKIQPEPVAAAHDQDVQPNMFQGWNQ